MSWLRNETLEWEKANVVTFLVITASIIYTLVRLFKWQHKVWLLYQLPGPRGFPVLGNALYLNVDPPELFQRLLKVAESGEVARFWTMYTPYCLISSATAVEVILRSQKHLDKSHDMELAYPFLGLSLLTSTGSHWQTRRKLLTPAFHFKILEQFVDVFNKQSNKLVNKLQKKADGNPFNISTDITLCLLDAICETAMGRCINAQENSDSDYVHALKKINCIIHTRMFRPWLRNDFLFRLLGYAKEQDACLKILNDESNATITEKRRLRAKNINRLQEEEEDVLGKKKRLAFLDLLLEFSKVNPEFTEEEMQKEVNTFMFAGHDTTATGINWILYTLGLHPHIQTRVQEELDDIFGSSDRPVTVDDVRLMKYTEMCIKETFRIFPPVPITCRQINEDIVINKYRIPAGTTIKTIIYKLHRDPEQFPDPEVFDPDRFLLENVNKRHPYSYVPFSAGPRNCIEE
ncbi:cytochrome P450 4C1-like isoform X2 [Cherax quadricarinatus]|uniref:cytochrome P450 4C1-like isoform X2 n=1 Tax=Cherax quadricarinatus TaxID=27406 RepID=UPI00387E78B9